MMLSHPGGGPRVSGALRREGVLLFQKGMLALFLIDLKTVVPSMTEAQLQDLAYRLSGQREFYESNDDSILAADADLAYDYVRIELERRQGQLRFIV